MIGGRPWTDRRRPSLHAENTRDSKDSRNREMDSAKHATGVQLADEVVKHQPILHSYSSGPFQSG